MPPSMRIPVIQGVIDRRILVNYRVEPQVLTKLLPAAFRPKQVRGFGVAGICLIRLSHIRPKLLPLPMGIGSENAAHRIAVEWEQNGARREGVYVPRRDTSSRLNTLAGGRLFPGEHHHAQFQVREESDKLAVSFASDDGGAQVSVIGQLAEKLPATSIFASLGEASEFFEHGALGYSATTNPNRYDGMELRCKNWSVTPLDVSHVESSFFENADLFPPGSAVFDCALLMRGIQHEWHSREDVCCAEPLVCSHN